MQDSDSLGSSSPSSSSSIRQAIQASLRTYNAETQGTANLGATEDDLDSMGHGQHLDVDDDIGSPVRFRSRDSSSSESSSDDDQLARVRPPATAIPSRPVVSPPPPVERPPIGHTPPVQRQIERQPSGTYRGDKLESVAKSSPMRNMAQPLETVQRTTIPQSAVDRLTSASKLSPKEPPTTLYRTGPASKPSNVGQRSEPSPFLVKKSPPTAAPVPQKFPAPRSSSATPVARPSGASLSLSTQPPGRPPVKQRSGGPHGDDGMVPHQEGRGVKDSDAEAPYITEEESEETAKREEGSSVKSAGKKNEKTEEQKRPTTEGATYTYHPDWGAWGRAMESFCAGSVCDWCCGSSFQPCSEHTETYALRPVYRAREPEPYRYHGDVCRQPPVVPMTRRSDVAVFGDGSSRRAWREVIHPKRVPEFSGWETFDHSYGMALPGTPVRVIQERECLGGCVRWNEAYNGYIAGHEWPVPPPRMGYCEEQTTIPWYPQLLFYQSHE